MSQNGGYEYFIDSNALDERISEYKKLKSVLNGDYPYEILSSSEIRAAEPMVGWGDNRRNLLSPRWSFKPVTIVESANRMLSKKGFGSLSRRGN